ncbi:MAG: hypothetical protein ACLQNV_28295, partial [Steroidobacteraceae bacterium]
PEFHGFTSFWRTDDVGKRLPAYNLAEWQVAETEFAPLGRDLHRWQMLLVLVMWKGSALAARKSRANFS